MLDKIVSFTNCMVLTFYILFTIKPLFVSIDMIN